MRFKDFSQQGWPTEPQGYYYRLQGRWLDGSPVEYGGDGFHENTFPFPYSFEGNPGDTTINGITECHLQTNPFDRSGDGATGPFYLPSGGRLKVDIAFTTHFAPDVIYPCPDITKMRENIAHVKDHYELHVGIDEDLKKEENKLTIYPNPTNDQINFKWGSFKAERIEITDLLGQLTYSHKVVTRSHHSIQVDDYPTGIYFVSVFSEKEEVTGKFVVQ